MNFERITQNERLWPLIILVVCFLALAPVWRHQGVFWDGWIYEVLLRNGTLEPIIEAYSQNGRTMQGWLLLIFGIFENKSSAANIVGSCFSAIAAASVFVILNKALNVPRIFAALTAILGVLHPSYITLISLSMIAFPVALGLFWFGLCLILWGQGAIGEKSNIYLSTFGGFIIWLSFFGEATVFMTPILSIVWFLRSLQNGSNFRSSLVLTFRKSWWILLISVMGVLLITLLFPVSGEYASSRITIAPYEYYFKYITLYIKNMFEFLSWPFLLSVIVLTIISVKYRILPKINDLIVLGIVSYFFAILPYILAFREPSNYGWQARFLLFSALSMAMISSGICQAVYDSLGSKIKMPLGFILPIIYIIFQFSIVINQSLTWYDRWQRDRILMEELALLPQDVGLIIIDDRQKAVFDENYRWYELQAMTISAVNRLDLIAITPDKAHNNKGEILAIVENMMSQGWSKGLIMLPLQPKCVLIQIDSRQWFARPLIDKFFWFYLNSHAKKMIEFKKSICNLNFSRVTNYP